MAAEAFQQPFCFNWICANYADPERSGKLGKKTTYQFSVRGEIPANLTLRISALHALAILQATDSLPVSELQDQISDKSEILLAPSLKPTA